MEYQLSYTKIFDALISKIPIIIAAMIVAFAAAYLLTDEYTPNRYKADSTVYSVAESSYKESVDATSAMRNYVDIVRSCKVAERASAAIEDSVSPAQIMKMVSASYVDTSSIITISATAVDPEVAIQVANAVSEAFVKEVINITTVDNVRVLDPAYQTSIVFNGRYNAWRTRVVATLGGAFLAVAGIIVFAIFDKRVKTIREVTLYGEIPLLGIIPDSKKI